MINAKLLFKQKSSSQKVISAKFITDSPKISFFLHWADTYSLRNTNEGLSLHATTWYQWYDD